MEDLRENWQFSNDGNFKGKMAILKRETLFRKIDVHIQLYIIRMRIHSLRVR